MDRASYQINASGRLLYMAVQGTMDLQTIWRLDSAFWREWNNHDRILMDYRAVEKIDISVHDFTQAGIAAQSSMTPPSQEIKAAYVASDPAVYGFIRVVEEVWSSFITITCCHTIDEALQWLDLPPEIISEVQRAGRCDQ